MGRTVTSEVMDLKERVSSLEARMVSLESKMDLALRELRDSTDELSQRISSNFRLVVSLLLGHWLTFIGLLVALLLRFG